MLHPRVDVVLPSVYNMTYEGISITDLARDKVKENLKKRGKGKGIKVGVKTTGCSGMAYTLEYVDELDQKELYWIGGGPEFMIISTTRDFVYLQGLTIDWVKKGLNEGFDFINPNEKDRCGCGESFRI